MSTETNAREIIDANGGVAKVSRLFGVSAAAVSKWGRTNRIPPDRLADLTGVAVPEASVRIRVVRQPKSDALDQAYRRGVNDTVQKLVASGVVSMADVLVALVGAGQ